MDKGLNGLIGGFVSILVSNALLGFTLGLSRKERLRRSPKISDYLELKKLEAEECSLQMNLSLKQ